MSLKACIIISLKKIIRNKKNFYNCISICLCTVIFIAVLLFKNNFNRFINQSLNTNIGFRTLSIQPKSAEADLGHAKIGSLEHIEYVYNSLYDRLTVLSNFQNDTYDGYINFNITSPNFLNKITEGQVLEEDDEGVAICPKEFYPDSHVRNLQISDKNIIDGDSLIGQTFTIDYYAYKLEGTIINKEKLIEREYKIIGVYDSTKVMNANNDCYIAPSDMQNILASKLPLEVNKDTYPFMAIVDDVKNVDTTIRELKALGFADIDYKIQIDPQREDFIKQILIFITLLTILGLILINILYVRKKIEQDSYNIGILRVLGYKKSHIQKFYFIDCLVNLLISILMGIILAILLFYLSYFFYLRKFNYLGFDVKMDLMSFVYALLIILIIGILTSIGVITLKIKKQIMTLIGEKI